MKAANVAYRHGMTVEQLLSGKGLKVTGVGKTEQAYGYGIPWSELDKLVEWRLLSPSIARKRYGIKDRVPYYVDTYVTPEERLKEGIMQKTYSLELRVDFADKDKFEVMRKLFQQAALHLTAQADLLMDRIPAAAAVFDDDFYSGKQQISMLADTIQQGKDMIGALTTPEAAARDDGPSEDLLRELRNLEDNVGNVGTNDLDL
jgi:hypothetical protein